MLLAAAAEQYVLRDGSDGVTILDDFLKAACLVVPELCPAAVIARTVTSKPHHVGGKMTPPAKKFYYTMHDDDGNDTLETALAAVPEAEFSFDVVRTSWSWKRFEYAKTMPARQTEPLIVYGRHAS
jgi:hypothetical protein